MTKGGEKRRFEMKSQLKSGLRGDSTKVCNCKKLIERFTIECRKTNTKVKKGQSEEGKYLEELIRAQSKNTASGAGKRGRLSHNWF